MPSTSRHALVVATSAYKDANLRRLNAPAQDAAELAGVLKRADIGGFEVTLRKNRTAPYLWREIEAFFASRMPDDLVLLYFSGHGLKDDAGNLYIATRDTNRKLLNSTTIPDTLLRNVMRACRARTQVLILDCCFGGAFSRGFQKGDDQVDVNDRFQGRGTVILTASTAMEFAYESETVEGSPPTSIFTGALVQGLRSGDGDLDGDGKVSVRDLYDFAYKYVLTASGKQTPTITTLGQEGSIFLATVPAAVLASRLPQPLAVARPSAASGPDLSPWTKIHDQGQEGINPAVAAVTAMETSLAVQGRTVSLSPRYIYQKAKQLSRQTPDADPGAHMDVIGNILEQFGCCEESDWPFRPNEWQLPAGRSWKWLDARARSYRARLYPVSSIDDLQFHLSHGRPVLAALKVFESNWYVTDPSRPGWVAAPNPDAQLVGSVAATIVACDPATRSIRFAHTWGEAWGDHGFGQMGFDALKASFADAESLMSAVEIPMQKVFRWEAITLPAAQAPVPVPAPPPPERAVEPVAAGPNRAVFDASGRPDLESGPPVRTENQPPVADPMVNAAYDNMGHFHRFFLENFGRTSFDGRGGRMEAVVHYGRDFDNAFWDGQRAVFGDGDGKLFRPFSTSLDVVAKEFALGLLYFDGVRLPYEREPGALYQSLAYVLAIQVREFRLRRKTADTDWRIAADVFAPGLEGSALVSFAAPGTAYNNKLIGNDQQPAHMSGYVKTASDNGGIHVNCGIPNHAFYRVAEALGGHVWERAGQVWWRAMHDAKLKRPARFADFAAATDRAARKLYGQGEEVDAVRAAWEAVGVPWSGRTRGRSRGA